MTETFFISDTHFGHRNILTFKDEKDKLFRGSKFSSIEEMDEHIIEKWNSIVKEKDKVYHLGDVSMNRKSIRTISRCNGRKILIKGNHDIFKPKDYLEHFKDIRSYHTYPNHGIICSHIPVYSSQLNGKRWKINIHGHTHHTNVMREPTRWEMEDLRYINVCVEKIGYTPINFEEILKIIKERGI